LPFLSRKPAIMVGQLRHHEFLRHAYCDAFIFSPGLSTRSAAIYADCITSWSELTSATIVRSGYTLISIAGLFDIACREWRTKATAAKAMPAFQMKFRLGNQARQLIATGTAPQLAPHRTAPQLAPHRNATGTAPHHSCPAAQRPTGPFAQVPMFFCVVAKGPWTSAKANTLVLFSVLISTGSGDESAVEMSCLI
jgi:hypothetical protein